MSSITLFHNAMSTCSQKVRFALEEKALSWNSREINLLAGEQKADTYLAINPKGVVPTLQIEGTTVFESTIINECINELVPAPPLLPNDPVARAYARRWPKMIDEEIHAACGAITFGTIMRNALTRENVLALASRDKSKSQSAARLSLFEQGAESPVFMESLLRLVTFVSELDAALVNSTFLAGDELSLADIAALPYVLRLDHLGLSRLWTGGSRPAVEAWYVRLQSRPAFESAISKWLNAPALLFFKNAGVQIEPVLDRI